MHALSGDNACCRLFVSACKDTQKNGNAAY
jgi:hypothetical protein